MESMARPKIETFSGRSGSWIKFSATPASETETRVRWWSEPTMKCCADESHYEVLRIEIWGSEIDLMGLSS